MEGATKWENRMSETFCTLLSGKTSRPLFQGWKLFGLLGFLQDVSNIIVANSQKEITELYDIYVPNILFLTRLSRTVACLDR